MLALAAAAVASPVLFDSTTIHRDAAPLISSTNAKEIPNSYMIKFKDHVTQELAAAHHGWVMDIHTTTENRKIDLRKRSLDFGSFDIFAGLKHTYNIAGGLIGYSGHFDEDVIEEIRRHPDVRTPNHASSSSDSFSWRHLTKFHRSRWSRETKKSMH